MKNTTLVRQRGMTIHELTVVTMPLGYIFAWAVLNLSGTTEFKKPFPLNYLSPPDLHENFAQVGTSAHPRAATPQIFNPRFVLSNNRQANEIFVISQNWIPATSISPGDEPTEIRDVPYESHA